MILAFERLQNCGIFRDFTCSTDLPPFTRYNLFYGWNGSGKTTLSKVFGQIERRTPSEHGWFKVRTTDAPITSENVEHSTLNIHVFNEDFVARNIDWDSVLESLLIVSEDRIEDLKALEEKRATRDAKQNEHQNLASQIEEQKAEIEKFLTAAARRTKENFRMIDTKDSYYLNYNRTRLKDLYETELYEARLSDKQLADSEVSATSDSVRPEAMAAVALDVSDLDVDLYISLHGTVVSLAGRKIVSESIDRLKNNPDINSWVEAGLDLHKKHASSQCEFCGQALPRDKLERLGQHFNEDFQVLKTSIADAIKALEETRVELFGLPVSQDIYPEFRATYQSQRTRLKASAERLNAMINDWTRCLRQKIDNPFDTIEVPTGDLANAVNEFRDAAKQLRSLTDMHNDKSANFDQQLKANQRRLELHFAAAEAVEFDYFAKHKSLDELQAKVGSLRQEIEGLDAEVTHLESLTSSEVLGATKFNEKLHRFVGHRELNLEFDPSGNGYRIFRGTEQAKDLSEGEKTAIAFVYFIVKLRENDNRVEDTIVVVDDPVSSFDSNHLFNAYAFLRDECNRAYQLFVMTHNFNFFKLVRDWFRRKNKNGKVKSEFYSIDVARSPRRQSSIAAADPSLVRYNSEYHYLFTVLYDFRDADNVNAENAFLIANLSRKLLEGFLSFKFPRGRNDFRGLLNAATSDDDALGERIFRFVNKYSHNEGFEFFDHSTDNLLGESGNVVRDVLGLMKKVDPIHYEEMIQLVGADSG